LKKALAFLLIFSIAYAQSSFGFAKDLLTQFSPVLKSIGVIPDFGICEGEVTSCDYFRGYLVVFLAFFMLLDVVVGINTYLSLLLSFAITGWLFNRVPEIFSVEASGILFRYSFAVMLAYVLFEYLFSFFWGISKRTRDMLVLSTSLMAVFLFDISNLWKVVEGFITGMSTGGFIGFLLFLFLMRIFNAYFSLMRTRAVMELRTKALSAKARQEAMGTGKKLGGK